MPFSVSTAAGGGHGATTGFGIVRNGLRYRRNGYHYDHLEDAIAYAMLMRSRPPRDELRATGPDRAGDAAEA